MLSTKGVTLRRIARLALTLALLAIVAFACIEGVAEGVSNRNTIPRPWPLPVTSTPGPTVVTTTTSTTTTVPPTTTTVSVPATTTTTVPRISTPVSDSECPYAARIHEVFDPVGVGSEMVRIAMRESRCQPNARNASGASGLFQIMIPLHSALMTNVCGAPNWQDPECNILTAKSLFDGAGLRPWAL